MSEGMMVAAWVGCSVVSAFVAGVACGGYLARGEQNIKPTPTRLWSPLDIADSEWQKKALAEFASTGEYLIKRYSTPTKEN